MVRECHRCRYNGLGSAQCLSCSCDQARYDLSMSRSVLPVTKEASLGA